MYVCVCIYIYIYINSIPPFRPSLWFNMYSSPLYSCAYLVIYSPESMHYHMFVQDPEPQFMSSKQGDPSPNNNSLIGNDAANLE